jgi:hypothetical protein
LAASPKCRDLAAACGQDEAGLGAGRDGEKRSGEAIRGVGPNVFDPSRIFSLRVMTFRPGAIPSPRQGQKAEFA